MIDCTREAALKAGRKYKSEAMNVVAESLKDASIAQLRNLHSEASLKFDLASTEDEALSAALLMQQIRYTVWKRIREPDDRPVTPVYIRREVLQCAN
jgi:hypothetical protein